MNVAINTQTAAGQKSGFGWYVHNLLEYIPKVSEVTFTEIAPEATEKNHLSTPQRFFWDQYGFANACRRPEIDLVHQPCFSAPLFTGKPLVVTSHDIIPYLFPQNFSLPSRLYFGNFMTFSYRAADHIIVDAEHTKNDLITHLGLAAEKITVIPLAASPVYHPLTEVEQPLLKKTRLANGIGKKYFIHVGTLEPRKNLQFLIQAFAKAKREGCIDEQLVITGKRGWGFEELFAEAKRQHIEESVIFTGYVADAGIPLLMAGATAFLMPSLYEGFGMPPLEAMRCGTPVISSDRSSLPEVVGETGILLDPTDLNGWVTAMVEISGSPKKRQELSALALKRAKTFSWEKTAKLTVEVYEKVLRAHTL